MQRGERDLYNGVLEGITFNTDYSALYTTVEEPHKTIPTTTKAV
jgi:hypothetical protein